MQTSELLIEVLRLARQEGALTGEGLEAFAAALGERAERVFGEQLARVDELERESAWRREAMTGIERENTWRRESMGGLERELAWRRQAMADLESQAEKARQEKETASRAHDQLLAHHREVLQGTVSELRRLAGLPLHRLAGARRRLQALAAALGQETTA